MTDLPRLAVTREQAEDAASAIAMNRTWGTFTLRLPERPTMESLPLPDAAGQYAVGRSAVPIPEGTRVEVGFIKDWNISEPRWQRRWHPVATATVGKVVHAEPDGPYQYRVTLTNIEEVQP